ncbi:hypothetical protein VZT92_012531 [Zoarces viviparus]|uniref:Uncharacterized protein n=1 Tax=Zoarces viviparus TaxID=48416 RepID=A0AAW1F265_ZOAVI
MQNRMALDMLLAEKGGVCSMFGDMCCTIIPNNTAPDGSVTKALNSLRTLSEEMHAASGIDNPFSDWMENMFGKWKTLIMSIAVSIGVFLAIIVSCGCCCIPCLRTMIGRLITTALSKENAPPPYGAYPLLFDGQPASDPDDSDDGDQSFELQSLNE